MKTYEQLLSEAKDIIVKSGTQEGHVALIFQKLKELGGTTAEALVQCSWEDLEGCGVPRLVAKQLVGVFRAKPDGKPLAITPTRAGVMSNQVLLENYDATRDDAVAQTLGKRSKGHPFLVFTDGKVDVDESMKQLANIQAGLPHQPFVFVNSVPHQTYCVGQAPERIFDENPLFPGEPLRLNGTCPRTEFDWSEVPHEVRQFARVAVQVDPSKGKAVASYLIADPTTGSIKTMSKHWPTVAVRFKDLTATGSLPSLKVVPKSKANPTGNDPFHGQL